MMRLNKKIAKFLSQSRITLENLIEDESIKSEAEVYGFDDQRLAQGLTIINEIETINHSISVSRGMQASLSFSIKKAFRIQSARFSALKLLLKTTFREAPPLVEEMLLNQHTKRTIPSFLSQALNFYNNCINKPHVLAAAAELKLTPEKIQVELNRLLQLRDMVKQHTVFKGDVERLVAERDMKMKDLKQYMKQLKIVLLLLFKEDSPQLLERLGIFMRNRQRRKSDTPPDQADEAA